MMAIWFGHPEWLTGVGALLLASAVGLAFAVWRSQRRIGVLLGPAARQNAARGGADAVLWLALVGVGLALLGPRLGQRSVWMSTSGADVVIALDVSQSMDARDVAPSRLDRARRAAAGVLERLAPESRAALAAFAGHGLLLTPLTPDTAALIEMLPAIDTQLVRPAGSNLRAGVRAALAAFEETSSRPRVLVVLSDGEVLVRPADVGQVEVERHDVRVVAAAFGDPLGATVPDRGAPLRDRKGQIVVSRRETRSLERLAEASGGRLWLADVWGDLDLQAVVGEIERDTRPVDGEFVQRRITTPLIWPFAAGAFALLWLELVWGADAPRAQRTRVRRRAAWRTATAAALLGALGAAHGDSPFDDPDAAIRVLEAAARERTLDAWELLELGLARAEAQQSAAAEHAFRQAAAAARDREHAAAAYHNLGVAALERGDYPTARDRFFDALAEDPEQQRSRFNLEWTLAALVRQPPEPAPQRPAPPEPQPDAADSPPVEPPADEEEPEPSSADAARSPDSATKDSDAQGSGGAREPLDEAARQRWLERVRDDPSQALRALADAGRRGQRRQEAPAW